MEIFIISFLDVTLYFLFLASRERQLGRTRAKLETRRCIIRKTFLEFTRVSLFLSLFLNCALIAEANRRLYHTLSAILKTILSWLLLNFGRMRVSRAMQLSSLHAHACFSSSWTDVGFPHPSLRVINKRLLTTNKWESATCAKQFAWPFSMDTRGKTRRIFATACYKTR